MQCRQVITSSGLSPTPRRSWARSRPPARLRPGPSHRTRLLVRWRRCTCRPVQFEQINWGLSGEPNWASLFRRLACQSLKVREPLTPRESGGSPGSFAGSRTHQPFSSWEGHLSATDPRRSAVGTGRLRRASGRARTGGLGAAGSRPRTSRRGLAGPGFVLHTIVTGSVIRPHRERLPAPNALARQTSGALSARVGPWPPHLSALRAGTSAAAADR